MRPWESVPLDFGGRTESQDRMDRRIQAAKLYEKG